MHANSGYYKSSSYAQYTTCMYLYDLWQHMPTVLLSATNEHYPHPTCPNGYVRVYLSFIMLIKEIIYNLLPGVNTSCDYSYMYSTSGHEIEGITTTWQRADVSMCMETILVLCTEHVYRF